MIKHQQRKKIRTYSQNSSLGEVSLIVQLDGWPNAPHLLVILPHASLKEKRQSRRRSRSSKGWQSRSDKGWVSGARQRNPALAAQQLHLPRYDQDCNQLDACRVQIWVTNCPLTLLLNLTITCDERYGQWRSYNYLLTLLLEEANLTLKETLKLKKNVVTLTRKRDIWKRS